MLIKIHTNINTHPYPPHKYIHYISMKPKETTAMMIRAENEALVLAEGRKRVA